MKIIPIGIQAGIPLTLIDLLPGLLLEALHKYGPACMYRPLAFQHSRTLTLSFNAHCCFETYRDFDTAIKRKSLRVHKGCNNTAAFPCGPRQSRKFCIMHLKLWDHSPYSHELHHVAPQCLTLSRRHLRAVESDWILRSQWCVPLPRMFFVESIYELMCE